MKSVLRYHSLDQPPVALLVLPFKSNFLGKLSRGWGPGISTKGAPSPTCKTTSRWHGNKEIMWPPPFQDSDWRLSMYLTNMQTLKKTNKKSYKLWTDRYFGVGRETDSRQNNQRGVLIWDNSCAGSIQPGRRAVARAWWLSNLTLGEWFLAPWCILKFGPRKSKQIQISWNSDWTLWKSGVFKYLTITIIFSCRGL